MDTRIPRFLRPTGLALMLMVLMLIAQAVFMSSSCTSSELGGEQSETVTTFGFGSPIQVFADEHQTRLSIKWAVLVANLGSCYLLATLLGRGMAVATRLKRPSVGIACEAIRIIPLANLLPKLSCEQMRAIVAELEEIDKGTVAWREVLQNENRFVRSQMGTYPNPIKLISALWQGRDMRQGVREKHALAAAHLRLLVVELALHSYKCEQGSAPGNLRQLVPKYLRQLPTEPFSDKPLIYRVSGTNWVLYSLGPDGVDDGGKPVGKSQNRGDLPI